MSHSTRIPVFARPFRFVPQQGDFATVEQDSIEDIIASLEVLLETVIGSRIDLINYGVRDMLYTVDIDTNEILARIAEWCPRALTIIETDRDMIDEMIRNIRITLLNASA